jgi:hypothetical protein
MPEVNTNMFIDDNLLSEFDDLQPIDVSKIEPDIQISPIKVEIPQIDNNPVVPPTTLKKQEVKLCPKSFNVIKPNRKLVEKPIQPNYVIEQNVDQKLRYIQKPGMHTILPVQNVRRINLPDDQMEQVFKYLYILLKSYSG